MNFIDPTAKIGKGTKVWHFAVILQDVVIGKNCNIGSGCEIGRGSVIGDNTRIGAHTFLPPNSIVGNNVFIAPKVGCCDDKYPISNNPEYKAQPPVICDNASIGLGAVLLPGVVVGMGAMIGAGSVVTKNVPENETWFGNTAKKMNTEKVVLPDTDDCAFCSICDMKGSAYCEACHYPQMDNEDN